jgi:hypothetical protein
MTTATFVRPAGWSYDDRGVAFGRDIVDHDVMSLAALADPERYRAIIGAFGAKRADRFSGAGLTPLRWAVRTASAVLVAPALIDGRMLLIDPDELGVVISSHHEVEHYWARPSECELRATPARVSRVLEASLEPVVETAADVSGLRRGTVWKLVHDATVATCDAIGRTAHDLAGQRARDLVGVMRNHALRAPAA